jgi:hypothetical protein
MRSPTSPKCRPLAHFATVTLHNRALRIIGEDRQQAGHGVTGWRGQVQRLGQGNEPDTKMFEFPGIPAPL